MEINVFGLRERQLHWGGRPPEIVCVVSLFLKNMTARQLGANLLSSYTCHKLWTLLVECLRFPSVRHECLWRVSIVSYEHYEYGKHILQLLKPVSLGMCLDWCIIDITLSGSVYEILNPPLGSYSWTDFLGHFFQCSYPRRDDGLFEHRESYSTRVFWSFCHHFWHIRNRRVVRL